MKMLQVLLRGLSIKKLLGPIDIPITTLCFDSRQAVAHSCFVAIVGTQVDGHNYVSEAIAAGSSAIVCEELVEPIQADVTYIVVDATDKALGIMAANFYDHPSKKLKVVAVTGTNGKTTMVHLLYNMVKQMGYKAGMVSTICNKILDQNYSPSHTTPDALQLQAFLHLMVEAGCQYCFIEASSHGIVQNRLAGVDLLGAIFTNISHEHLDYHIDFLHYIKAKKKLFDTLPTTAFALVNQEDKNSSVMLQNCKAKKFTFSICDPANFRAKIVTNTLDGLELEIEQQQIWFQLIGAFNASNLVAAYGASQLLGLNSQKSLVALSAIPPALGRMNKVYHGKKQHVIIDYAHTPDALEKVMATLYAMRPTTNSRLLTVMGCGGNRDKQKRVMIGKILADNSDMAIFTSDNPRDEDPQEIINSMQLGVPVAARQKVLHIIDRTMALKMACLLANANDVILIAGKGHENYQEIKGVKHYFCEEEIIQAIYK
ncbi:UDP-N-acetylmuramoyl-L-alanyl-D-glutamate--2,6-diaminopimelate ligase [Candidatus Cardinium hertigii]|jgi:UDP-N-acetylmuramoyl-L-alanyl-D-glutamate--2,6-diaminopimelate ligase|uniref:UDP-N-acetylmuramoyl-L-alanyl-D-glutamate--2,6-diaminopimelate ligase n=1 Tax=Candidatus Cardinium hertigii TaxID=247481 RepID=A0A3N2QBF2_9BACT|nr:UDP-N-acetylmuramoyl-L-alanyl-D-glutamate--2,6-diaminopimelate ligase [Candidatus Cardinium hertigii]ROT47148.1 UDP-N-acetylmuramoyl-L-alanyl-D-glutamate--2,6-diaminopimelate ligase [Candidatus Cardinium hertigii]